MDPVEGQEKYLRLMASVAEKGERNFMRFQLLQNEQFEMLHSTTGQPLDLSKGAVWVTVSWTDESIGFGLEAEHSGAAVLMGNFFEVRAELTEDDTVLFFFNVPRGVSTLTRDPDLEGCTARESVTVEAGRITWVHVKCGLGG